MLLTNFRDFSTIRIRTTNRDRMQRDTSSEAFKILETRAN